MNGLKQLAWVKLYQNRKGKALERKTEAGRFRANSPNSLLWFSPTAAIAVRAGTWKIKFYDLLGHEICTFRFILSKWHKREICLPKEKENHLILSISISRAIHQNFQSVKQMEWKKMNNKIMEGKVGSDHKARWGPKSTRNAICKYAANFRIVESTSKTRTL